MLSIPIPLTAASFDFALPFPGWPQWARVSVVLAVARALTMNETR